MASRSGLLSGNRQFVLSDTYDQQRQAELHNHEPCYVVVCCSDSRVPPEIIFNELNLGTMFVVRTAGHVIDAGAMESIRYALVHLHANSVIVLGHQHCGAVKAVYDATTTHNYSTCLEYPFLCQYISPSIVPDSITSSIARNTINTVDLINKTFNLRSGVCKGAYYDMETGRVSIIYPKEHEYTFAPKGCRKYRKSHGASRRKERKSA